MATKQGVCSAPEKMSSKKSINISELFRLKDSKTCFSGLYIFIQSLGGMGISILCLCLKNIYL